jgi:hypothetical protein
MTHGEPHHNAAEHATPALPFSDAEWQSFRQSDKAAGRNIVVLMTGIFVIGVILYAIIDIICAA